MSSFLKRWWWVWLSLAVVAGFCRLRIDADILGLLPPDEPTVQGLKLYQEHFSNSRELILTLRAPDAEKAEQLAQALAVHLLKETNSVTDVSWQPPWMDDPGQLTELLACLWLNQPPESFGGLTNKLAVHRLAAVLEETKATLATSLSPIEMAKRAADPFHLLDMPALTNLSTLSLEQGQKMFASSEGNFRLLFVQARADLDDYRSCAAWMKSMRGAVDRFRASQPEAAGLVIRYTGRPAFVTEIATGMQRDMSGSVVGTAAIIALLFWLTHRRWLPMLWLLALLGIILVATLALGGLVLGTISVVSMGFAAVLLGLAVDYAVVHYQEALAHPHLTVPEIRRAIAPSILWAAITTICAFLVLNLGGLPGLGQLGTLVAIGIGLAALVMVMVYLPPLFPGRRKAPATLAPCSWWSFFLPPKVPISAVTAPADGSYQRLAGWLTGLILLGGGAILWVHLPGIERTGDALRPQVCDAEAALQEVTSEMGIPQDALWLFATGQSESEVYERLVAAEGLLTEAASNRLVRGQMLPTALWPRPECQAANRIAAAWLVQQGPVLREAALREGFSTNALGLTEGLIQTWARASGSTEVIWPTNQASRWLLKRFVARAAGQWCVMGLVYPSTNRVDTAAVANLSARLSSRGVLLSGWSLVGETTLRRVQAKMWQVVLPMVLLVVFSLWMAFRRMSEVWLGLAVLLLSGLCLLATMSVAGWSWNLLNLMAVPLMLGTGVDYSLFMQLALRRHGGDLVLVRRSVGRALLLCGGTAVAGFGSLAWSGNLGMASLGRVCAVGIGANMLIAVFLLPAWWTWLNSKPRRQSSGSEAPPAAGRDAPSAGEDSRPSTPSAFYCAQLWRWGLLIARLAPAWLMKGISIVLAELYFRWRRQRREVVVQNLLPAFSGDRAAAEQAAHRLYRNFAIKLVDLWRFESGVPMENWLKDDRELEIINAARGRGRGVLFITLHLGNWEYGGALLHQLGIRLTVLTMAEPQDGLTALRAESRARYGIDTLIVGQDSFALVEVIKQLQAGAALAIAIDRPGARGAARVALFGQPFDAPMTVAELARASGCALVGVTMVRRGGGCAVKVLPEFTYDRRALGQREARQALTQQILRAFEAEIRKNIEQWYHFVPIWPKAEPPA